MPAFDELRDQLRQARNHAAATADARATALDRVRRAQRRLAQLERTAPAATVDATGAAAAAVTEERAALEAALADHRTALATVEAERLRAREAVRDAIRDFEPVADPRRNVGELDDTTPILLLPVRLETRFKTVTSSTGEERSELWLRIYPDDCSIDTFEPALSDSEVESARRYWVERWAAAGIEDEQRAAWRGLVASHGAGRASWIVERYEPVNGGEPAKLRREDLMLVVASDTPLDAAPAAAAADYWRAVWRADGDAAQVEAATAALVAAVGQASADNIVASYRPENLSRTPPAPHTRDEVNVDVAFLTLPAEDTLERREASWSRPPTAALMPDRFVFLGYRDGAEPLVHLGAPVATPLVVGPDPTAPDSEQLHAEEDGELFVPEAMRWMVDFDEAVAAGMGMRIPIDATATDGFDRVLVVGLRLSDDEAGSADALATLLAHHRHGPAGLELVPQGTPTNNAEGHDAGEDADDDPDASFDDLAAGPLFTHETDWLDKRDGQWLAEYLGVDAATLANVHHAGGRDQADARAMNTLLWPATLGYWMDTMMAPVFDRDTVEDSRLFFTHFVSGRGAVPALRIADQPYGIMPATPFSRMRWPQPGEGERLTAGAGPSATLAAGGGFLATLHDLLQRVDADWKVMAGDVRHTGSDGDAHQILLDVIGLHPTSEEYAQRYAEGVESLFNRLKLSGLGGLVAALIVGGKIQQGTDLLTRLGYNGDAPDILGKLFLGSHNLLKGPLVTEAPLSETAPLPAATPDGHNYLHWLGDAAATSLDALYRQQGFEGDRPSALLYLLVRHALQLGYDDAGLRLYEDAGLLAGPALLEARKEPPFLHIAERVEHSESRYGRLYATEPAITGSPRTRVADFIATSLPSLAAASGLRQQLRALERLVDAPTARLERVLAEHVDCASYRLDAWLLGLVHYQLALMRGILPGQRPAPGPGAVTAPEAVEAPGQARQGIHLGAYAWLEEVRPRASAPEPVEPGSLPDDLAEVFDAAATAEPPLERDPDNQGWIHAPSLNQAVAAAVLRSAYASDASPDNPGTLAVNLTSERARRALALLEGLQGGQSLGALLGFQLERGLHDRYDLAEVDRFIYPLRKAFPLAGDRMASTRTDPDEPITSVEARNVVDGLALAEHVNETGQRTYPFGIDLPPPDDAAQQAALDAEVERLLDSHDAVSDLALAEGVYQAVLGNYDRVASTYDAYAKGEAAPEPQVVRTPTAGPSILQRVALHLEPGLDPAVSPVLGLGVTPRAHVEPALNRWLAGMLPDLDRVACVATYRAAATGAATDVEVTLADLGLQPADVLHLLREESDVALAELDERVIRHVVETQPVRPDVQVTVRYMDTIAASFPVFQVLPLVRALRRLVGAGRPLVASDLELAGEAAEDDDADVSIDAQRVVGVQMMLQDLRDDARDLRDDLDGLTAALDADLEGNLDGLVAGVEGHVHAAVALLARAATFGLPQSGWAFAYAFRQRVAATLRQRAAALVDRWDGGLAEFDALLAEEAALPVDATDEERFVLLADAERLVSTVRTSPPPPIAVFRAQLATARGLMATRRDGFSALAASTATSVSQLLAGARAAVDGPPPVTALEADGFPLDDEIAETVGFVGDTAAVLGMIVDECGTRLDAAQHHLDEHDAAAEAAVRVEAIIAAARALLGDDVLVIPEFGITTEHGAELAVAQAVSDDGTLLSYLEADAEVDLPVDTWLYGAARVRQPLRALEQVIMLAGALETAGGEPELVPLQLPARPDDRWLSLDIPPEYELDREHLCYTAHFATPLDPAARQCGLLLDEWSEVIPERDLATGVAFHYDRPNAEAPQTMLLVTPPAFRGAWQWDDIVDALHETLDLAKRRAVEPAHLDRSAYAPFLPATVMAVTVAQLSISANLALNNQLHLFTEGS